MLRYFSTMNAFLNIVRVCIYLCRALRVFQRKKAYLLYKHTWTSIWSRLPRFHSYFHSFLFSTSLARSVALTHFFVPLFMCALAYCCWKFSKMQERKNRETKFRPTRCESQSQSSSKCGVCMLLWHWMSNVPKRMIMSTNPYNKIEWFAWVKHCWLTIGRHENNQKGGKWHTAQKRTDKKEEEERHWLNIWTSICFGELLSYFNGDCCHSEIFNIDRK